jgi:hypothetical protein
MVDADLEDLVALDRDVARAARAAHAWRSRLTRGETSPDEAASDDPFAGVRRVAGKSTWDRLRERNVSAADEALLGALRRWVYALLQVRIGLPDDVAEARVVTAPHGRFEGERTREVSWREAWRGIVAAKTAGEARLWFEACARAAPHVAPTRLTRASRRSEVARRMGLGHPWEGLTPAAPAALAATASRFLERTRDLSFAVWHEATGGDAGPAALWNGATAREAGEGWPARLSPRWLDETFGALVRGLPVRLPPLPPALGAASFARALASFGHALREAIIPPNAPFALAHDPWFLDAHRLSLVFGALPTDREFHLRVLGLGLRAAEKQARILARTTLLEARTNAARIVVAEAIATGGAAARDVFEEALGALFGEGLDPRLRGAWPAPREDEPARWVATLQAEGLRRSLRDTFDVDWFKNPHAWNELRSRGAFPAHEAVPPDSLDPAADALTRAFEDALG